MHGGNLHYAIFKDVHSRALQIQKDYDAVSVVLRGSCDEGLGMKDAIATATSEWFCYQPPAVICELGRSINRAWLARACDSTTSLLSHLREHMSNRLLHRWGGYADEYELGAKQDMSFAGHNVSPLCHLQYHSHNPMAAPMGLK